MEGRPRLKRGRGEGRGGKGKGREGREEGDVGGPRDILSRGPRVPSYATAAGLRHTGRQTLSQRPTA